MWLSFVWALNYLYHFCFGSLVVNILSAGVIYGAVKVSFCGGAVGGVGFSLFHFFKIKGF